MPFSPETKARMFIRSARICALCFKQCGTNIEAAHIIAAADRGSDDDDNGIPLCFDCHQETGAYDSRHPKGNKFTPTELRARRDQLYALVDGGTLQALIVAEQLRASSPRPVVGVSTAPPALFVTQPHHPSKEAKAVLAEARKQWGSIEALPGKLRLLAPLDRAYVQDQLLEEPENEHGLKALLLIASREGDVAAARVLLEQLARRVTLAGSIATKVALLTHLDVDALGGIDETIRSAFYRDLIDIMDRDQFNEVNLLTPAIVNTHKAIPPALHAAYMKALFDQVRSGAYQGAPAAQAALRTLPPDLAQAGLNQLTVSDLVALEQRAAETLRAFVLRNEPLWPQDYAAMLSDFARLSYEDFSEKYW